VYCRLTIELPAATVLYQIKNETYFGCSIIKSNALFLILSFNKFLILCALEKPFFRNKF
jgi:hypothetical protein